MQPKLLSRVWDAQNGRRCFGDLKTAITNTNQYPENNNERL